MFIRQIELRTAKDLGGQVVWKDAGQANTYVDYIVEVDKFIDAPEILYACSYDGTKFVELKNTGVKAQMRHTFAGWPFA